MHTESSIAVAGRLATAVGLPVGVVVWGACVGVAGGACVGVAGGVAVSGGGCVAVVVGCGCTVGVRGPLTTGVEIGGCTGKLPKPVNWHEQPTTMIRTGMVQSEAKRPPPDFTRPPRTPGKPVGVPKRRVSRFPFLLDASSDGIAVAQGKAILVVVVGSYGVMGSAMSGSVSVTAGAAWVSYL